MSSHGCAFLTPQASISLSSPPENACMSSLYKLLIKGIRSFDPEREETIQFGFPLTLICGQNGTGKTTIIECLKYACTGDLPPNSKGGAFVHDPALSGRSLVTGQVKLAFRDTLKKLMILTRTVQLTKRKQRNSSTYTNTFKTLEGQLAIIPGQGRPKLTVLTKNAELDSQTPLHLGALKAVIDYVIFCHQDELLWPLAEGLVLKKRFDDIFEASKYTKVLDNFKAIRKEMATQIKLLEQSVEHLRIDKQRATKVQAKIAEYKEKIEKMDATIAELAVQIDTKEAEARSLFDTNQDFQKIIAENERLVYAHDLVSQRIEEVEAMLEERLDHLSDGDLLEQEQNFSVKLTEKKQEIEKLRQQRNDATADANAHERETDNLVATDAKLHAQEIEYKRNHEQLAQLIDTHAELVGHSVVEDPSENVAQFGPKISKFWSTFQKRHTDDIALLEQQVKYLEREVSEIENSITQETKHRDYLSTEHGKKLEKLQLLKTRLSLLDSKSEELAEKQEEVAKYNILVGEKKQALMKNDYDEKLANLNQQWAEHELKVDDINRKIGLATQQAEASTKLDMLRENQTQLQQQLRLGEKKVESILKGDVASTELAINAELARLTHAIEVDEAEAAGIQALLAADTLLKAKTQDKLDTSKRKCLKVLELEEDIVTYETDLAELEDDYKNVMEDLSVAEVTRDFNVKAILIAESKHLCMLCQRLYDTNLPEFKKFVEHLKLTIDKERINKTADLAAEIGKELDQLKAIQASVLEYRQHRATLAAIKPVEPREEQLASLRKKVSKAKTEVERLQTSKRQVLENLRLSLEITRLDREIDDIVGDTSTTQYLVKELQAQQQLATSQMRNLRTEIDSITLAKQSEVRELQKMENKVRDAKVALSQIETQMADVTNIELLVRELDAELKEIDIKREKMDETLVKLNGSLQTKKATTTEEILRLKDKRRTLELEYLVLEQAVTRYNTLAPEVVRYERTAKGDLERSQARIEESKRLRDELRARALALENDIKKLETEVVELGPAQQNIRANLELRRLQAELNDVDDKLEQLNVSEAQEKLENYSKLSDKLRQDLAELNATHNTTLGEKKQIINLLDHAQHELDTEYAGINEKYHTEWVNLQTHLLVLNDIQVYAALLDNAIMKYHSLKMEEINRILRELWQQTYKGLDIDTIAIKTDVHVTAKMRSYNYRVVMFKKGQELDMRGRCLAGQKVLTSILIRLALAECFGVNCGIIALDEPTTNLDKENAVSLAQSLNRIIGFRKQQLNFQLIVITHDEHFLEHINGDGYTDHFYRIKRDEDETSKISRVPISQL